MIKNSKSGYSLLELSVILLIVALISGSGIMVGKTALDSTQSASTSNRLNAIENALLAFRLSGNRLPCPADGTMTEANSNFGVEAGNVGDCTNGAIKANFSAAVSSSKIVEGVVPVRTLNLPDEFMYDGWGRKITYAVWAPMTGMRAFINYGVAFNCGLTTLLDAAGEIRSKQANYVLLSYGPNGHGAFTTEGTKFSSGSTNPDERMNCHCDGNAVDTGYAGNYVFKEATEDPGNTLDNFDDITRYKERWQLESYNDQNNPQGGLTCPQALPGFRADGVNAFDASGTSVAVGDVNGDGIPDLIIGAPGFNGNTGAVYVVFGTQRGFPDPLPLATLNGTNGFRIDGVTAADNTGFSVAAGDVNGDNVADIIIGANQANSGKGSVFVLFGSRAAWPATFSLSGINGTNGIRIDGVIATSNTGWAVASGDINNDGYSDIIIGAPFANTAAGEVYTVFGAATYARSEYTLDNNVTTGIIDNAATHGFRIDPIGTDDQLGYAVTSGSTQGNGLSDVVMGHNNYTGGIGLMSVLRGKGLGSWYTPIPSINFNGSNGWHAFGINSGDKFGSSLAVGDVNGDNVSDIIIGAPGASPGGRLHAGITYVLFGNNGHRDREFYMTNLNGYNGFEIDGVTAGDQSGSAVAVGDINNDGAGDIVIGAPYSSPGNTHAGTTYVLFGNNVPSGTEAFNLSSIDGTNGFILWGYAAGDLSGSSVATGDVNGDGKADVIIGAPGSSRSATTGSGSTYVYFGQRVLTPWGSPISLGGL